MSQMLWPGLGGNCTDWLGSGTTGGPRISWGEAGCEEPWSWANRDWIGSKPAEVGGDVWLLAGGCLLVNGKLRGGGSDTLLRTLEGCDMLPNRLPGKGSWV